MWTKKLAIVAAALATLCLVAQSARAQSSTAGAIQGVVTDKNTGEALAGVTVIATSPALQGEQTAMTDEQGTYKITNLPPGSYQVAFYFTDIQIQRTGIEVQLNKVTPVYQAIDTSKAGGEVIQIRDRAPTIDPTSTTQGVTIGQDYLKNIPVPGLTFEDALGAAAGTSGDDMGVSFSGSSSLENQYVVDGVNTTGLTYGTVGSPLVNNFIEEIEVITGGYQAEYGRSTGGVVNVVTKSGSNEFHGSVFSYFTNSMLSVDAEPTPTQASPIDFESNLAYDLLFGFDLGGPIIKDKLWFYVGFAPRLISLNVDRITKRRTDCRQIEPDGSLSTCDPTAYFDGIPDEDENGQFIFEELERRQLSQQGTEYQFVSKVNYALAPEHQGQVTLSGTPISGETVGIFGDPQVTTNQLSSLTTNLSTKWTSKFNDNKTEIEAVLGWFRTTSDAGAARESLNDLPAQVLVYGNLGTWGMGRESAATLAGCTDSSDPNSDPFPFITNCPDEGVGYRIGGPGALLDDTANRYTARLTGTQRVELFGNHSIKAGVDLEDNRLNRKRIISGDAVYTILLGQGGNITEVARYVDIAPPDSTDPRFDDLCGRGGGAMNPPRACDHSPDPDVPGQTVNWAAFLQDSWQIMPNLTFNAGVRYEEQRLRYAEDLQNTVDPFTGRALGKNAMVLRNMWAPRLGLLYDWTKEGRSKIYTSYGRFYESIPLDINDRQFGGETFMRTRYDHGVCGAADPTIGGPSGPACVENGGDNVLSEPLFGTGVLVMPGLGGQYLDEFALGAEYELLEDLKVGLAYQRRSLGNVIEDVSVDNADTYILANPGEFSEEDEQELVDEIESLPMGDPERVRLERELEQFRGVRGFDKPRRDYNALTLTVTRRFNRDFLVQGSYTYSRTTGNYQGLFSSNNGQVDPNITSQYDLIELLANRDGPLPQDRPHYLKLDASYAVDFEEMGRFIPGIRFRALSGSPTNALGRHYLYGPDESVLLPRGSVDRVDFEYGLDLRARYSRELGRGMTLDVFADFFNLLSYEFLNGQGVYSVDETYTFDPANPVVGGDAEDLVFLKRLTQQDGLETGLPVRRNRNFGNPAGRYGAPFVRLGAQLTF